MPPRPAPKVTTHGAAIVTTIPTLRDNYTYLVQCAETGAAALVDVGEAAPVLAALPGDVAVEALLATHHHDDHVGGHGALLAALGERPVYASAATATHLRERSAPVHEGAAIALGALTIHSLAVPGHTDGALAFYVTGPTGPGAVFTGDTLFLGGCGRLFEGTHEQLYRSLLRLGALPPETAVFPGHEYTAKNLAFARALIGAERSATEAAAALAQAAAEADHAAITVPGTIAGEWATNVFLRAEDLATFTRLRRAKDCA